MNTKLTKILDEFFSLGGNHDQIRLLEIRNQLLDFLRIEEILLAEHTDENLLIAKDAIRLIDASNIYVETTNRNLASIHVKPFFDRLRKNKEWSYCEIQLFVCAINYIEDAEDAVSLAEDARLRLSEFKIVKPVDMLEGVLACNLCSRLLYALYFDNRLTDLTDNFYFWLEDQFIAWRNCLKDLENKNEQLEFLFLITEIRMALFQQDDQKMKRHRFILAQNYDQQIIKTIKSGIHYYEYSDEYQQMRLRRLEINKCRR